MPAENGSPRKHNDILSWRLALERLMAAVLHFWSDVTLVKVDESKRCLVLTEAVQGTDHFPSVISEELYIVWNRCFNMIKT